MGCWTRDGNRRAAWWRVAAGGLLLLALTGGPALAGGEEADAEADPVLRWAVNVGASVIADNKTFGIVRGDVDDADGDQRGWVWRVGGSYVIHQFDWGKKHYHPHLETTFGLHVYDERGSADAVIVQAGLLFRWRDFPWNDTILMSIGIGGGLSYADDVPGIDVVRHLDDKDRSEFKFYGSLEVTFAHPQHPRHEIVLFNDHFSGGHIMDEGGWDTWGIAYRYRFPPRTDGEI